MLKIFKRRKLKKFLENLEYQKTKRIERTVYLARLMVD